MIYKPIKIYSSWTSSELEKVARALSKAGFSPVRQRGSHVFLKHPDGRDTVVPVHPEVNRTTLMDIISEAGLTMEI